MIMKAITIEYNLGIIQVIKLLHGQAIFKF